MRPASVGFHCPKCVSAGGTGVRTPRTLFGAQIRPGSGTATKVLMVLLGAVWVVDLVVPGAPALQNLVMSNYAIYLGEFWRLVTGSLTSGTLLGVAMNLLVLWLAGRALESELGAWRFVVLYLTAGLGGATLYFCLGPTDGAALGAYSAAVGLLAANTVGKRKQREDIRPDLGLLLLLLLFNILINFGQLGWLMLLGGVVVGALVGAILAYAPSRHRNLSQIGGLAGLVLLCLAAVAFKLTL
jgi:membrane associated rhomboid family serine protease